MKKVFCDVCGGEGAETIRKYCIVAGTNRQKTELREIDICPVCNMRAVQNMANNELAWFDYFESVDCVKAKQEKEAKCIKEEANG